MNVFSAVATVALPLSAFIMPGLLLVHRTPDVKGTLPRAARAVLWSVTVLTLASVLAAALHLPLAAVWLIPLLSVLITLSIVRRVSLSRLWPYMALAVPLAAVVALFSLPLFLFHDGLPTGDIQKAILWAQRIQHSRSLPSYSEAVTLLNRDPVDFYTPGLHALTALLMTASKHPLTAVSLASIAAAVSTALMAAALAVQLFPHPAAYGWASLAFLFVVTNSRFLRYLREPGYHFQNVMGELLLFGALLLAASLLQRLRRSDAVLLVIIIVTLALTHQFSAFLAVFLLSPAVGLAAFHHRARWQQFWQRHAPVALLMTALLLGLITSGFALGLHNKIPHLFTATPHLLAQTPPPLDYPRTLGAVWFWTGLAGLGLLVLETAGRPSHHLDRTYFVIATIVLLLLSQGPRFGLDIPPVRALFYSVVPLSIAAVYFLRHTVRLIMRAVSPVKRAAALALVAAITLTSASASVDRAYALSHAVRTNSTMRAEYVPLIERLKHTGAAALIDDYNRRAASWLVLSGQPMFTRLAADLERQMDEAAQSPLRRELYLNQLDFEKIFSLGSLPEVSLLMAKHNIRFLTGVLDSSHTSFMHNPALQPVAWGDDVILFELRSRPGRADASLDATPWLLKASTLANDIGDREDTFEHLPASLRSTRLSQPQHNGSTTWRVTTAPYVPLQFNVGDFVRVLWDQEKTGRPDAALTLYIRFAEDPPSDLTISTPAGTSYPMQGRETSLSIAPHEAPFDDKGFITLTINNPASRPLAIDLIALGPARVP